MKWARWMAGKNKKAGPANQSLLPCHDPDLRLFVHLPADESGFVQAFVAVQHEFLLQGLDRRVHVYHSR